MATMGRILGTDPQFSGDRPLVRGSENLRAGK